MGGTGYLKVRLVAALPDGKQASLDRHRGNRVDGTATVSFRLCAALRRARNPCRPMSESLENAQFYHVVASPRHFRRKCCQNRSFILHPRGGHAIFPRERQDSMHTVLPSLVPLLPGFADFAKTFSKPIPKRLTQ